MNKYIITTIPLLVFFLLIGCKSDSDSSTSSDTGQGGSTARFTIINDYLYTVNENSLRVFDITLPESPNFNVDVPIGFGIETIFPYKNNLFIGSQTGMYIYDLTNPKVPSLLSTYRHVYSCDPVVVQGNYAYVTLRSGNTRCRRGSNELQIIDISNLSLPKLVQSYPMSNPKGLGVDGNNLFICDNGIKIYDISVTPIQLKTKFSISANDLIPFDNKLLVIGDDGFYQYKYTDTDITLLSSILKTYQYTFRK